MAGRKMVPGAEVRKHLMSVRWTDSEVRLLGEMQKRLGVQYLVDVPRDLALKQIAFEESLEGVAEQLEKARKFYRLDSIDEVIKVLVIQKLQEMSSELESVMTE